MDKDLSDIMGEVNPESPIIYVTDYYSIENHLTTEEALINLVIDTFHFQYANDRIDYTVFKNVFNRELAKFHANILPVMAWIVHAKRNGQRPSLDNVDPSWFIVIDENMETINVRSSSEIYDYAENRCGTTGFIRNEEEIKVIIDELKTLGDPKRYTRGKYELWFFVRFVEKLISALEKTEKLKVRTRISEGTAISILAPRITIPVSLAEFIDRNLAVLL